MKKLIDKKKMSALRISLDSMDFDTFEKVELVDDQNGGSANWSERRDC